MSKANNLFKEILFMLDTWCDDTLRISNRADFTKRALEIWNEYNAYPRMVSVSNKSIVVVWSNEIRHRYLRSKGKR